jgi:hypothetical protein
MNSAVNKSDVFFFNSWGGVRQSPLGKPAIIGRSVPVPDDDDDDDDRRVWSSWWNESWHVKPKYSENTCPSATFCTK